MLLEPPARAAFEFRHASWFDDEGLCVAPRESSRLVRGGYRGGRRSAVRRDRRLGYMRLLEYTEADLATWAEKIRAQSWKEAFVFFKHEDEGTGPKLAARFMEMVREARSV